MKRSSSLEVTFAIWYDDTGESVEVGEDRDGLDLMEIRFRADDGKISSQIRFRDEQIPLLIEAVQRFQAFRLEKAAASAKENV